MSEVRVVVDTNVFVKGVLAKEPEVNVFNALVNACHCIVSSQEIVDEYCRVVQKFGYRPLAIIGKGLCFEGMGKFRRVNRRIKREVEIKLEIGEDDRHIVEAAIAGKCQYIVSEDGRHFLSKRDEFKQKHQIAVVSPDEYIRICLRK